MMESSQDPILKQSLPADDSDSQLELYSIPTHSSWFAWDNIHEIEKVSLKEFFDFSSITRTRKIYKEYRDFIISKYREDPSRRLTFSEVRRSLVGDVNYLQKVFSFLERWGLINFGVPSPSAVVDDDDLVEEEEKWRVKVEEGPPYGVRVVAAPNSLKPLSLPPSASGNGGFGRSDFKMPPLASHSNVFDKVIDEKRFFCGNCNVQCDSGHYESAKEGSFIICIKCFQNGKYGNNKSFDDFKFVDCNANGEKNVTWTEAETLLLLESVLKHGDDWELVAQSLQTKSKLDCISKLIELPFGELMLGSAYDRCRYWETISNFNGVKQGQAGLAVSLNTGKTDNRQSEANTVGQENGDAESQGPPSKKLCIAPISDVCCLPTEQTNQEDLQSPLASTVCEETVEKKGEPDELKSESQQNGDTENQSHPPKGVPNVSILDACSSLMKQVARISAMVGPQIAASAAEGAVTALCNENLCPREIFDEEEYDDELGSSTLTNEIERTAQGDDSEMDERQSHSDTWATSSEKRTLPIALRVRAASATALGAAAARAKLLAVQEDREVEHLMATIIDTQLKKLQYKMKLLEEVEVIMEKEFSQMEEVEESLLTERMDVIQRVLDNGISRLGNHTTLKPPHTGTDV